MFFILYKAKIFSFNRKNSIMFLYNHHMAARTNQIKKNLQFPIRKKQRLRENFFPNLNAQLSKLIIDSGIKLEKKGKYLIAECPFHQENSPSLFVDDSKGVYHCFGCGASGNIFSFRKNFEKNVGKVDLTRKKNNQKSSTKSYLKGSEKIVNNQNFFTSDFSDFYLIQKSSFFFHSFFNKYKKPKILLNLRNISHGVSKIYQVGYSSNKDRDLFEHLKRKNYSVKEILRTGIVFFKKINHYSEIENIEKIYSKNYYYFDMFRNRLIIPIRNSNGLVIGFGGRLISKNTSPKYINSSENNIFKKKKNIFSHSTLKESVFKDPKIVIIVEGYLDTMTLFQNGIRFSVASLGTNFSFFQIKKSKNISINKHICIFFDSDEAGEKGISRFMEKIFSPSLFKNLNLSITKIPISFSIKDPDEFIVKKGTKNLIKKIINHSVPILKWYENFLFLKFRNQYFLVEKIFSETIILNYSIKNNVGQNEIFPNLFRIENFLEGKKDLNPKSFMNKKKESNFFLQNKTENRERELHRISKNLRIHYSNFQNFFFLSIYFPLLKQDLSYIFFSAFYVPPSFFEFLVIDDLKVSIIDSKNCKKYFFFKNLIFRGVSNKIYEKTLNKLLKNFSLLKNTILLDLSMKKYTESSLMHKNFFIFLKRERMREKKEIDKLVYMYTYNKKKKKFFKLKKKDRISNILIEENIIKKIKIISQIDNMLENIRYKTDKIT